jgi:pimeloyl-ACP methyl ester carboxylesterase
MALVEKKIQVGSLEWFYRQTEGNSDKPTVVFLHGIPAHSFMWCELMTRLEEKGFSAIAPDWIGSGFSAKPDKREFAYNPEAYIKALSEFLAALELEKFSLAVQGFIATAGIQYALANPDKIDRLIIFNTPITIDAKLPWKMQQWGIPFAGDMLTQDPILVDRTLEGGSGFVISDANLEYYRLPYRQTSSVGRALVNTIQNLKLKEVTQKIQTELANFSRPTQIIWGVEDPWLDSEAVEKLAKNNSNIELLLLPEAKHYPQEHFSQEIGEPLLTFLRRQLN